MPPEGDFPDLLYAPVPPPEPDPEQTPEQHRAELFGSEIRQEDDNYANPDPGDGTGLAATRQRCACCPAGRHVTCRLDSTARTAYYLRVDTKRSSTTPPEVVTDLSVAIKLMLRDYFIEDDEGIIYDVG